MRRAACIPLSIAAILASSVAGVGQSFRYFDAPATRCIDRKLLTQELWNLGERPHAVGVRTTGGLAELWIRHDAPPSWSIIIHLPNGDACLVGAGNEWITGPAHDHPHRPDPDPDPGDGSATNPGNRS